MKIHAQGRTLMLGDSTSGDVVETAPSNPTLGDVVEAINIGSAGLYRIVGVINGSDQAGGLVLNPGEGAVIVYIGNGAWWSASKPTGGIAGAAPVDAVASAATLDSAAPNSDLTFTAKTKGDLVPPITVTLHNSGVTQVITCTVVGRDILVGLANTDGTITSTAANVKTKVDATAAAAALVTVAVEGSGAGTVDAITETPLDGGVDGTPAVAGQIVTFGGEAYIALSNGGSSDTGVWKKITTGALS